RHLIALLREWKAELAPEVIILGGQLSKGLPLGLPIPAELNVRLAELGEDSALWGAYENGVRTLQSKWMGDTIREA
ncbi:MAG: hypothetical protein IJJ33_07235, partial [Victivallales bacterium]|nr:hypothetical protein [Victivallales bacterium]